MSRRMSVSMTLDAVRDRTKTVTRRHVDSWQHLAAGDRLTLIEKGMGLPKGAKQVVVCEVEIVDVCVETLRQVTAAEVIREGLIRRAMNEGGSLAGAVPWFRFFWARGHGYSVNLPVDELLAVPCRRIEWRYLDDPCPECRNQFGGKMPGHVYGSGWDWVPCQTCFGAGLIERAPVVPS